MHLKFLAKYITHSMYYKHLLQLHILWYGFPTLILLALPVDVVAMRILIRTEQIEQNLSLFCGMALGSKESSEVL